MLTQMRAIDSDKVKEVSPVLWSYRHADSYLKTEPMTQDDYLCHGSNERTQGKDTGYLHIIS